MLTLPYSSLAVQVDTQPRRVCQGKTEEIFAMHLLLNLSFEKHVLIRI